MNFKVLLLLLTLPKLLPAQLSMETMPEVSSAAICAVQYKSMAANTTNSAETEIIFGRPGSENIASQIATDCSYGTGFDFVISYDAGTRAFTSTTLHHYPDGSTKEISLEIYHDKYALYLAGSGAIRPVNPDFMNYLQLSLNNAGKGSVTLSRLVLNDQPVGDTISAGKGSAPVQGFLQDMYLSKGFTLKGTVALSGSAMTAGFAENSLLLSFGYSSAFSTLPISWKAPLCTKIPGSKNRISWTDAETVDTRVFEVLRSVDGINYTPIGSASANTMAQKEDYQFEDILPHPVSYYRICSIDVSQRKMYSPVIKVVNPQKNITIMQNSGQINLVFGDNSRRSVAIMNMAGQLLSRTEAEGYQHTLNTVHLRKGIYLLRIDTEGFSHVQKFAVL